MTTLPKMIAEARYVPRNNLLFCLILLPLTLPKKSAFGKVSCMEKHLLLPQMTASLYLGLDVVGQPLLIAGQLGPRPSQAVDGHGQQGHVVGGLAAVLLHLRAQQRSDT